MVGAIEPITSAPATAAVDLTNLISSAPLDQLTAQAEVAQAAALSQQPGASNPLSPTTQAFLLSLRESGALAPLPGGPTPTAALQHGLSDLSVALTEIQAALNSAGQTQSVATLSLAGIPLTSSVLATALTQLNATINSLNTPDAALSPGVLLYEQTLETLSTIAPPDPATTEANPLTGLPHVSSIV